MAVFLFVCLHSGSAGVVPKVFDPAYSMVLGDSFAAAGSEIGVVSFYWLWLVLGLPSGLWGAGVPCGTRFSRKGKNSTQKSGYDRSIAGPLHAECI